MTEQNHVVIVHQWHIGRLFLLAALILGLGVGLGAVFINQEVRSRATVPLISPTPLVPVEPPMPDSVKPPYLRLTTDKTDYNRGDLVKVDLYLDTGSQPLMEADMVIVYDEKSLAIKQTGIQNADVFKSVQIETDTPDQVLLTFFVTPTIGHKPIKTEEGEVKIGSVVFEVTTAESGASPINITTKASKLVIFSESRSKEPENVLNDSLGITLSLNQ